MADNAQVQGAASFDARLSDPFDHLAQLVAALLVLGTARVALGTGMMADLPGGVNDDLPTRGMFDDVPAFRTLLMAVRQALIIILRGIEEYLDMEQSIPRRQR